MKKMEKIYLLSFFGLLCMQCSTASNCYQEMNYEKLYGYKYDINCNSLNESNLKELQKTIVKTKVKLTIIQSNLTIISSKFFKNIPNTKQLVINSSIIPLHKKLFTHFNALDALVLNNNSIKLLPQGFLDGLKSLRVLKLTFNMLNALPKHTFLEVDLEKIDLSFNYFSDFKIPCELQQLTHLYISHNQLSNLQNFSLGCFPLLRNLNFSQNSITQLKSLKTLRYLQKIDLSKNLLEKIYDSFAQMENLQELNLESNLINHLSTENFRNIPYLTSLNLANNSIITLSLPNFKYLKSLDLEANKLRKVPSLNLTSLAKLSLSHNELTLDKEFFTLPYLSVLRLSHCNISKLKNQINTLKNLEIVDLSYSNVNLQEFSFKRFDRLREIDLSGNSLYSLRNLALRSLEILNLSHNAFTSLELDVFSNCKKISVLDLSRNQLVFLHEELFNPLESLTELHLEKNQLKHLSYSALVSNLKNLRLVNINENQFSCQFLSGMVHYFDVNHIGLGLEEKSADYEENVAGIRCSEDKLTGSGNGNKHNVSSNSDRVIIIIVSIIFALLSFIIFVLYKILLFLRKQASVDEIELLERRIRLNNFL